MTDTPETTLVKNPRQKAWRERNAMASWAHAALRSAIKRGLVQPRPCEVCGHPKAEGHHGDYSMPAAVTWLCREHHRDEHRVVKGGRANG